MASPAARESLAPPSNVPDAPADPMSDPKLKRQVEVARSVAYHLLKGIKMIGMYRHNESKYGDYLMKAHAALVAYHQEFGPLQLKVDLTNFQLHKQDLFSEDSQLPYKFFKDGIRQLIFRPGFTVEELTAFTTISLSDPDRGAEDINAQLWRAQMPNFEYIMVEGFRMDEFSGGRAHSPSLRGPSHGRSREGFRVRRRRARRRSHTTAHVPARTPPRNGRSCCTSAAPERPSPPPLHRTPPAPCSRRTPPPPPPRRVACALMLAATDAIAGTIEHDETAPGPDDSSPGAWLCQSPSTN